MITEIDKLRRLIAENKMDRALQSIKENIAAYPDLQNQLLTISAKFNDIRKKENMGMLDDSESMKLYSQVNYSVLELLNEIETTNASSAPVEIPVMPAEPDTPAGTKHGSWFLSHGSATSAGTTNDNDTPPEPSTNTRTSFTPEPADAVSSVTKVFISYNHNDMDVANKLKDKLKAENINVVIDSERMQAGEDIKEFIEKCIRETSATISLISKNSLLSAWVAMESINTYKHEQTNGGKKFIACYINDDFFKRNFTDDALDFIEGEIKEIQSLITARMEKNRSIRDLQNELSRLSELRNNMDEIIRHLRESLCIDIREGSMENNFQKILQAIQS